MYMKTLRTQTVWNEAVTEAQFPLTKRARGHSFGEQSTTQTPAKTISRGSATWNKSSVDDKNKVTRRKWPNILVLQQTQTVLLPGLQGHSLEWAGQRVWTPLSHLLGVVWFAELTAVSSSLKNKSGIFFNKSSCNGWNPGIHLYSFWKLAPMA